MLLSVLQFFAHRGGIDLSKQRFQAGLAVEEDFAILRISQVFDRRRVGQHGAQGSPQGLYSGFAAAIAFEVTKEPFHEIVGALGLDGPGASWGRHDQRRGKKFGTLVLNVRDHFWVTVHGSGKTEPLKIRAGCKIKLTSPSRKAFRKFMFKQN